MFGKHFLNERITNSQHYIWQCKQEYQKSICLQSGNFKISKSIP